MTLQFTIGHFSKYTKNVVCNVECKCRNVNYMTLQFTIGLFSKYTKNVNIGM